MDLPPINPTDYGLPKGSAPGPDVPVLSLGQNIFARAGLYTRSSRFITTACIVGAITLAVEPSFAFDEFGPKSFALISKESEENPTTWVPWWLVAVGAGVIASEFF